MMVPDRSTSSDQDQRWAEYAEAAHVAQSTWADPASTIQQRRETHQRAISAHERFKVAFLEPTPDDLLHARNRLACEGVLLLSALAALVGLFLPDLEVAFWPLALTFASVGLLGAWLHRFAGRLGSHLRRHL